jgi:hypothetical protein
MKRSIVFATLDRFIVLAVMLLIFEFCAHFTFSLARSSHWLGGRISETTERLIYLVPFGVFLVFLLVYFIVRILANLRAIKRH